MKFLRDGPSVREKPGVLDVDGGIRDLSGYVRDVDTQTLAPEMVVRLSKLDCMPLPIVDGVVRLGCPVGNVGKFIAGPSISSRRTTWAIHSGLICGSRSTVTVCKREI